ncbi:hypothetical protein CI102_2800, partial [Trichoderma harzianum]
PTRLVDVQSNDGSTARLVNTKELASDINPKYLILSYCWGMGNQPAKTTRSNLRQRKHRIMVYDLPKTIQNAITITRLMGIRYLWVDALCIIQPDNDDFLDDWNSEAAQMGNYYSNALFCISALYASEGFLGERHSARYPWREEEAIQYGENFILSLPKEEALGIVWLGIVTQYASMKLTKPTDRLAAIHGVARRLSLQHNVEYFGGIFKGFYSRALPW